MSVVYGSKSYIRYFNKVTKPKIDRNPRIVGVKNGIIFPHGRPSEIGVYDENHKFVNESNVMERPGRHKKSLNKLKNIKYTDEDVLYIGDMHWHFGHFLIEHLNRLYPVLDEKYKNMKCAIMHKTIMDNKDCSYIYALLNIIGIKKNRLIIIKEPTQFKNVFVPEASDDFNHTSKEFNKTFDAFVKNINSSDTKKYEKIYVSREKLGPRSTFGEKYISKIFEKNGFHILYPETMPIMKQIEIISGCNVLAGCAGTALHLALFMKKGGVVIQLKRNRKNQDNCVAQNYINTVRGLNGVFIDASVEKYKTEHYTAVPQIISLTPYLQKFFDDNNFVIDENEDYQLEYCEYIKSLKTYRKIHGNSFVRKLKSLFVKISSCFIPGRERRNQYRRWLKQKLKI